MKPIKAQTLGAIAATAGASLVGNPDTIISRVASLPTATGDALSFFEDSTTPVSLLQKTAAGAVILAEAFAAQCPVAALISPQPRLAFAKVVSTLVIQSEPVLGAHPSAVLGKRLHCSPGVSIGPSCVVGDDVFLGEGVILEAGVVVGSHCHIGERTRLCAGAVFYPDVKSGTDGLIHSGCVIGSDGFGFVNEAGRWLKLPQLGGVRIGHAVEIGANTTIDCGALQDTIIEDGVILDNQIQIGHNVHIGAFTAIAGCVGIAGSTRIGRYCLIGGGCCIAGHLVITDHVQLAGMSGVSRSILEAGVYSSAITARPHRIWKRNVARLHHLEALAARVKQVEQRVLLKAEG